MAESDYEGWDPSEWLPLNHAFVYVKNRVGSGDLAAYDLREALEKGRIKAMVRSLLDGNRTERNLSTEFWKTASLTADLVDQYGVTLSNRDPVTSDSDEYWLQRNADHYIFLRTYDVFNIWPDYNEAVGTSSPAPASRSSKSLIAEEVERRLAAGELKGDERIGKVARSLQGWLVENRLIVKPIGARRIESILHELKLWPAARK
jgi:hypothetical protein